MAKVLYDREACIGCAACTSVSTNWVMNSDGDKAEPKKLEISAEELAAKLATIHYEVVTRINPLIERIVV